MGRVDVCRKRAFFSFKEVNSPGRGQVWHFLVICRSLENEDHRSHRHAGRIFFQTSPCFLDPTVILIFYWGSSFCSSFGNLVSRPAPGTPKSSDTAIPYHSISGTLARHGKVGYPARPIHQKMMGSRSLGCVPHFLVALVSRPPTGTPLYTQTLRHYPRVSSQTSSLENDGFQVFRVCYSFSSGFCVSTSTWYTQFLRDYPTIPYLALWPDMERRGIQPDQFTRK